MNSIDTAEVKRREHKNWSAAAEGWKRRDALLSKGAEPVTALMLKRVNIEDGCRLLDIASGTGEPSISAAKLVGDSGEVIGTDLVEEMLVVGREKALKHGLSNIEYYCIDAEKLKFDAASFDAVTIRWGLMFMPNPLDCLTIAHKVLNSNGKICIACWSVVEKNPFVGVLINALSRFIDLPKPADDAPGIFAFSNPERLREILIVAGFSNITIEEVVIDVLDVEDGREYWEAISDLAAPVMAIVNQLDDETRNNYIQDVIVSADKLKQGDRLRMKGTTWVVTADKFK